MKYKILGRSGLRVSELCLGTMTFGEEWGWGSDREESKKVWDTFADAGGNFIDTANKYTLGTSEKLCGEFLAGDREHFVLATKYTLSTRDDDPNFHGNHRKNMVQAVEVSFKRFKTEYIDLLWVHAWDGMTPPEEVMRGLDDLVRAGKVFYVGVSDTPAWRVAQMNTIADLRGWTPFVALQIEYSLIQRTVERDLIPMAKALDLAVTPWAPLGGGMLTGKYTKNKDEVKADDSKRVKIMDKRLSERNFAIAKVVQDVADARDVSPAQVAINWVRQQSNQVIPIIGARTASQVKDNLACLSFTLNESEIAKLDEVSRVELGFPQEFLRSDGIRKVIYGETFDKIEPHRPLL